MKSSSFRNLDSSKRARLIELAKSGNYARMLNVKPDSIAPVERGTPLALSFAQQRLWFLAQMEGVSAAYHIPGGFILQGELNQAALAAALDRIVARHEALRTTFSQRDGHAVQVIGAADCGLALQRRDLSGIAEAGDRQRELERILQEEATTRFDLERGPLIRASLLRMTPFEHVLFFTIHHIVFDGWSMAVLMNEITALYRAYQQPDSDRSSDPLPPLPIQYPDYAHWQRRWLEGERQKQQADYWQQALAGIPALLELPTDRPRPAQQSHVGAYHEVELGAELTGKLKAFSQRHGVTLYMTLVASWACLLARLSGQEDIVIGSPTAGRNRSEIENLIGFFVNSLALRFELTADQTVTGLLAQSKQRILDAQQNQDLPIERILDLVRPPRSLAHSPIFQVLFALQNAPQGKLELPGLSLAPLSIQGSGTAKFDLTFGLQEQEGQIVGAMEYTPALYDAGTIARHLEHWRTLLEAMVADDTQSVFRLPLLSAAQRRQLLAEWNDTDTGYRQGVCVHRLFEEQAERTPEAIAVVFEAQQLTYAQLNAQANRLAHHLRRLGVGPDDRVAICAERGLEMVVGLFGILKSGAAYVPLDPTYPAERLSYLIEDSEPKVVLIHMKPGARLALGDALQRRGTALRDIRTDCALWQEESSANPDPQQVGLSSRHLAYVIYTSGSTGQPKGVMVEHASVVNLIHSHIERCELRSTDRVLQFASFAFDASVEEIFPPLSVGAATVLRPAEMIGPDAMFLRLLRDQRVTVAELPTAFWHQWAQAERIDDPEQSAAQDCLRLVVVGGEKAERRHFDLWRQSARGRRCGWLNTYGPTETTVYAIALKVPEQSELPGEIPIGRPISNTRIYILDRLMQPVAIGVTGEIYIGGAGVARGYLNRPELTAERFMSDPFGNDPQARIYKSGDLGRWLADGTIEYLGRNDQQVKIRGFRIELGEIEAKLAAIEGVHEAVVLAREDVPGDKRLVAYVVPRAGYAVESATLRDTLAQELAQHMLPSAYVSLPALPLTANGKLDRNALPAPAGGAYISRDYAAPQGPIEEALADIWSALLQCQRVGRHDNFFDLGGHSLLAMQLLSRIRQRLQVEVPLGVIFSQPILSDLAAVIGQTGRESSSTITRTDRAAPLAPSFAQQLLWSLAQTEELSRAYHIHGGIKLHGELSREALAAALNRIAARHEALRTTFGRQDGRVLQIIGAADRGLALRIEDLSALDRPREQQHELQRALREEAHAPFDLERGPLIRALLLRLAPQEHVLFFTLHHIISDGWSMGVLMNEVSALYSAYQPAGSDHRSDPLPPLPIQYADYAEWQRSCLKGARLQRQVDHWQRTLAGIPALLPLPTDRPRPARQCYSGAHHPVNLDAALSGRLKAFSQRHGVTLYMTLISSWAVLLGRLSRQADIVIGTPIAGRTRGETESLIGFFINILVLRLRLQPEQTVAGLLEYAKQQILAAQQHQDLPLGHILDIVQPPRSLAHAPLFQVMFAWQNVPPGKLELRDLEVAPLDVEAGTTAKYDLSLSLQEVDGQIVGAMEYASALFDAASIAKHIEDWRATLEAMLLDEHQALSRLLPLLPECGPPLEHALPATGAAPGVARMCTLATPFREGGRGAPLFIVHHISGACGYARDLMPWIDADVPIYGLSASGFQPGETPLASVVDMAALYISEMRLVQSRGPYRIAGYSAGGTIAYEIARQLLNARESVGFLGLIDTHGDYSQLSADLEIDAAPEMPGGIDAATLARYRAVQRGIARALVHYSAARLDISVDLYAAAESLAKEPALGWGELLNTQMRVHLIEANHETILKPPQIMQIGAAISTALRT
jgi:amino acid adenylation domain-containing protein